MRVVITPCDWLLYSVSLSLLKHLTVDCLKIDKYFIHDMLTDREALILISPMIELDHSLGYGIVAEGVETAEQLTTIKKLGCETAQGFCIVSR
ncbi:MAG: EAL domain-containing protein [Candidatus Thiodiazotropha sp. (ex Lucinoma annulata)]|nr:EAL domain-containing protein [Candidatus Thiodiazotropha sp. (ex Lucinoma annulata)]